MAAKTKLLLAALLLPTGCSREPDAATNAIVEAAPIEEHAAQTFATGGIVLDITGLPARPVARTRPFSFRVSFAHVPAGAGLYVAILSDDPQRHALSSGMLTIQPIAIAGTGVTTMAFTGKAASAPADSPEYFPVDAGRYRIIATVYSTREGRLGLTLHAPTGVQLAEYRSAPIVLSGA